MSSNMFMTSRIDGYGFCKLGYGFCKLFTKQQRVVTVLTLEAELNNKSEGIRKPLSQMNTNLRISTRICF